MKTVQALYDLDIVEDEQIVEWGESKPSKKYVSKELSGTLKEKAKKVIEWLKSAETESESEEVSLIKTVPYTVGSLQSVSFMFCIDVAL